MKFKYNKQAFAELRSQIEFLETKENTRLQFGMTQVNPTTPDEKLLQLIWDHPCSSYPYVHNFQRSLNLRKLSFSKRQLLFAKRGLVVIGLGMYTLVAWYFIEIRHAGKQTQNLKSSFPSDAINFDTDTVYNERVEDLPFQNEQWYAE